MYSEFFGLKAAPFSIAPDPYYLFMSERHREALAHLLYGVGGGGGFVLLTGDIGAGKTTVCRCFLEQIPRRCNVAYIFNPKLTVVELLQSVCDEFGIPPPRQEGVTATVKSFIDPLNEYLLRTHAVGQNNVLIIDEAQNLAPEVLEQLRLLTNLETNERKLLQIILIGQPELRTMLAQAALEQLAQRVIAQFHLEALSETETAQYIHHRLSVSGLKQGQLFDKAAIKRIYQLSQGVPRRINLLCDRALLGAYAHDKTMVDRAIVDKAASEVFQGLQGANQAGADQGKPKRAHVVWLASGALAVAVLAGMAVNRWVSHPHTQPQQTSATQAANAHATPFTSVPLTPPRAAQKASMAPAMLTTHAENPAIPTTMSSAELVQQAAWQQESQAWLSLGQRWDASLSKAAPCASAMQHQLMCFNGSGGLAAVRLLARPVMLSLKGQQGSTAYALLEGLSAQGAILQAGDQHLLVSQQTLATIWRGDFATLWRTPQGYRAKIQAGQKGPAAYWLTERLAMLDGMAKPNEPMAFEGPAVSRLQAFQMAQGLKPDGVAGATTLMLLNQATGVSEPRLSLNEPPKKASHVLHP